MAPLKRDKLLQVIDVGCGSNIWINELGMDASKCRWSLR